MSTRAMNRLDHRASEHSDPLGEVGGLAATPTGRRSLLWASAIATLATIGLAGAGIDPHPPEPERGMVASRLAVLRPEGGVGARPVVALAKPTGPSKFDDMLKTDQGLLARELVRQALLIAARDEMGLTTRDEVLDDVTPARPDGAGVEVASVFRTDGPSRIVVRRGEGAAAELILEQAMGPVPDGAGVLAMILPVAEKLSRADFPAALRKLGLEGGPNKIKAAGPPAPDVEELLEGLGFIEHFAAVRDLHEAIRDDGESPERVGALARAYAKLGVLTEFQWHPAHKVYKARALLYAQRLQARDPGSVWALRNRAFVKSVLGLHQEALDDLAEATKRAGDGPDKEPPAWVGPIEAYANYDLGRLGKIEGPQAKLARLLGMLAIEYPIANVQTILAAQAVVGLDEDCPRAYDAMCRVGGVSNLHVATTAGPEAFTKSLPIKLGSIARLPDAVRQAIDRGADELPIVEALHKAGLPADDRGEPSWSALAHLIRETRFTQVKCRLLFLKYVWSVPYDDYWNEVRPSVAGHRYLTFLEWYALPPKQIREIFNTFANKMDLNELESHETEMFRGTETLETARGSKQDASIAYGHGDAVARDLSAAVQLPNVEYRVAKAKALLAASPRSTFAQGVLVAFAWDEFKDRAQEWEEKGSDSPILLEFLAWRYGEQKQFDRAKALLRRCVAITPQYSLYKRLADFYKAEGDMEGWRKVYDEYLEKGEDKGLDHATTRVEIARYFMGQKRWKDAEPYAEEAAQTGAGWAMNCLIDCYEALGEWEKGEALAQQVSERYPNYSWARWYCYCKRTGHGDIEAARTWTATYLDSSKGRPDLADPAAAAYFYWLSGSTKQAFDAFNALYAATPNAVIGLSLMLVADEAGEKARRDEVMGDLSSKLKAQAPKTISIFEALRESSAADKPPDLAAVDAIIESMAPEARGNAAFLVGKYLMKRDQSEAGRKYLERALDSPRTLDWSREIARSIVRKPGQVGEP